MNNLPDLPVLTIAAELKQGLQRGHVILNAPPGSGKSTLIPLLLKDETYLNNKKIVMLEPRRIAARACAMRMAYLLGENVGETVGFQTRFERKLSRQTRIEVITEGLLTRRLQNDPELSDTALIIFDEFHERNLQGDLALALSLDVVNALRDDLRLLVMSATLDADRLNLLLPDALNVHCSGTMYPVDVSYLKTPSHKTVLQLVRDTVHRLLEYRQGDMLVFLPATAWIQSLVQSLSQDSPDVLVVPLYGDLSPKEQDQALLPNPNGKRKIVLATDIAETSLTIEGISIVIDTGLAKKPVFNANTGLTALETIQISKASATQRAGRAGRMQAGYCMRLWTEQSDAARKAFTASEIVGADLSDLALELLLWGVKHPDELQWVEPPPKGHWQQAIELLQQLDALDEQLQLTATGKLLARLPLHPRLASIIVHAKALACTHLGIQLAALLSERDIFDRQHSMLVGSDLAERVSALNAKSKLTGIHHAGLYRVKQSVKQFSQLIDKDDRHLRQADIAEVLSIAFSDRLAKKTQGRCYQMVNGQRACLHESDPLISSDYLLITDLDAGKREGRIYSAIAINKETIELSLKHLIADTHQLIWNSHLNKLEAVVKKVIGAVCLSEHKQKPSDSSAIQDFWISYIQKQGLACLQLSEKAQALLLRMQRASQWMKNEDWPDMTEEHLLATIDEWLLPWIQNALSLKQVQAMDYVSLFKQLLSWEKQQQLDELLPTHFTVPSGSHKKLDYDDPVNPVLSVRLQELFGLMETPAVCRGAVAIKIHILSPAQRPVQVTTDLLSFWKNTYQDVKKDLKGRYPKHYWPDDPYQAEAIRGVRRNSK